MSPGIGKCNKIRHIVRILQMLQRWRRKAALSSSAQSQNRLMVGPKAKVPFDVPSGHVAVCVGASCKRFIVRATYLNLPVFKKLLVEAEEEYGFGNQGPLAIPCDESVFEDILRFVSSNNTNTARFVKLEDFQRCCHLGYRNNLDVLGECMPLLPGFADKPVC